MKTNFLFILLFCYFSLNAQTDCDCYERLVNLSEYYTLTKQNKLALKTVKKALQFKEKQSWHKDDYLLLALKYAQVGKFRKTKENVLASVSIGYYCPQKASSIRSFSMQYNNIFSKSLEKFEKTSFWTQTKTASTTLTNDFRKNAKVRVYQIQLEGIDECLTYPSSTDTVLFFRVKKLLNEYGYPNQKEHGFTENATMNKIAFTYYIFHSSKKVQNEILNIMLDAQKKGYMTKIEIARILDFKSANQIFGLRGNFPDRKQYSSDLKNIENIDNRRFEYNLLRLAEDAEMRNKELPAKYKKRNYPKNYFCGYRFSN